MDPKTVHGKLKALREAYAAKEQKIGLVLSLQHRVTSLRDIRNALCEGRIMHRLKKSTGNDRINLN